MKALKFGAKTHLVGGSGGSMIIWSIDHNPYLYFSSMVSQNGVKWLKNYANWNKGKWVHFSIFFNCLQRLLLSGKYFSKKKVSGGLKANRFKNKEKTSIWVLKVLSAQWDENTENSDEFLKNIPEFKLQNNSIVVLSRNDIARYTW